jgi:transposase
VLKQKGPADKHARGRSRGGVSTTIPVVVAGLGTPLRVLLTAGQCHASPHAAALLDGLIVDRVIADRGSAGQAVINRVLEQGAEVVIPPHPRAKAPHDYDRWW